MNGGVTARLSCGKVHLSRATMWSPSRLWLCRSLSALYLAQKSDSSSAAIASAVLISRSRELTLATDVCRRKVIFEVRRCFRPSLGKCSATDPESASIHRHVLRAYSHKPVFLLLERLSWLNRQPNASRERAQHSRSRSDHA